MTFDALVLQLSRQTPWRVANDSPYVAEVLHPLSDRRASIEDRLLAIGAALPLVHRVCWERTFHPRNALFVCLHDAQQQPVYGWTVLLDRSRAMPGHTILRVRRFGATVNLDLACAGLAAMRRLCELLDNVLRLELEVFNPDSGMRDGLRKYALQMGFKRLTPQKHGYHNTIRLELDADQEMLFQRLTRSARRNVKAPEKKALRIRPITEPSFAPRMEQLMRETFARSGGHEQHEDWAGLIAFSQARPNSRASLPASLAPTIPQRACWPLPGPACMATMPVTPLRHPPGCQALISHCHMPRPGILSSGPELWLPLVRLWRRHRRNFK